MGARACRYIRTVILCTTYSGARHAGVSTVMVVVLMAALAWVPVKADDGGLEQLSGKVHLDGRSTLHEWSCESLEASLRFPFEVDLEETYAYFRQLIESPPEDHDEALSPLRALEDPGVQLTIATPVDSLDCGSRGLERDLRRAVRAQEYPLIEFTFRRVSGMEIQSNPGHPILVFHAEADIMLAGELRTVEVDITVDLTEHDELRFRMGKDLAMSDFDITPPTALFGLIRADDRFRFTYELTLPAG